MAAAVALPVSITYEQKRISLPKQIVSLLHHSLITTDFDALSFDAAASLQLDYTIPSEVEKHHHSSNFEFQLVVSPYNSLPHLLDLTRYDRATQLFAKALTAFKPIRDDYAVAEYLDSFNFEEVFNVLKQLAQLEGHEWKRREFYVVSFRSQLKPVVDSDRLFDLDAFSHQEAIASGGLLKYWYGRKDTGRKNLATCFWESREHARAGGRGPWHAQARAAAGIWYESIVFKTYTLTVDDDIRSWSLADFEGWSV